MIRVVGTCAFRVKGLATRARDPGILRFSVQGSGLRAFGIEVLRRGFGVYGVKLGPRVSSSELYGLGRPDAG